MRSPLSFGTATRCVALLLFTSVLAPQRKSHAAERPNIVLVMADDMGWGQTGYYDHPLLKTPHLDAMAANGLRFDRFYAGAPVCSPTRATVLTGRSNDRTGALSHGYPLHRQEKTLSQALQAAGYATAHFGKWHLNGIRGPGVPILAADDHNPGEFGFDYWLSVTNFFDRDPILSRMGEFEEFTGDSSEIIVDEAVRYIQQHTQSGDQPFLCVIWYGTAHSPWRADDADMQSLGDLKPDSKHHYGELVAMDRSIGALRSGLRDAGVAENTLVWFCSDNGGLPKIEPTTVGGLRGFKNTVYEGGLRVPAILEWPAVIEQARVTEYPAATMDIFPTLASIVGLPDEVMLQPQDGVSLVPLFSSDPSTREQPIAFRHNGRAALVDNQYKLVTQNIAAGKFELYDLSSDPGEQHDLSKSQPQLTKRMAEQLLSWSVSVDASAAGQDYPEGRVDPSEPQPRDWINVPQYKPYFPQWRLRPEYKSRLQKRAR